MRQGASRASRSTSRSTVILAIRRQVVSLPPVIVIIPVEVSYSSALREMSTDFFGSPVEISGRTPAKAPVRSPGPSAVPKNVVDRLQQVVDVLRRRARRARAAPRSRCRWCRRACAPATAARRSCARRPRARSRRRPAAGPRGERVMCVPRLGPDARQLGLVVELLRAQLIGPHAGRVDHVGGAHVERLAALAVDAPARRARGRRARAGRRRRRGWRRPRRSARPRRAPSAPGARRRSGSRRTGSRSSARARRSAGSSSSTSSPEITRWRSGLQDSPLGGRPARLAGSPRGAGCPAGARASAPGASAGGRGRPT